MPIRFEQDSETFIVSDDIAIEDLNTETLADPSIQPPPQVGTFTIDDLSLRGEIVNFDLTTGEEIDGTVAGKHWVTSVLSLDIESSEFDVISKLSKYLFDSNRKIQTGFSLKMHENSEPLACEASNLFHMDYRFSRLSVSLPSMFPAINGNVYIINFRIVYRHSI